MLVRWSWPRFRFDQLMNLAWKVMLPLGMVNLVVVAICLEYGPRLVAGTGLTNWMLLAVAGWATLVVCWLAVSLLSPATSDNRPRLDRELERKMGRENG
jgi:NADH-quinone oxidoreductase subunit H